MLENVFDLLSDRDAREFPIREPADVAAIFEAVRRADDVRPRFFEKLMGAAPA